MIGNFILAARSAVGSGPVVQPSGPVNSGLPVPYAPPSRELLSVWLLGVNGDSINLTDGSDGLRIVDNPPPSGFWLGEYDSTLDVTPGVDGARYGEVRAVPRPVGVTVFYEAGSTAERRALADRLARALNPKRGLAGFLVTEADNTSRMITGRYVGGGEQPKRYRQQGLWSITLDAADNPYWMDAPGSELPARTWKQPDPVPFYPYLPTGVSADFAIGEPIDIVNDGHEDICPDWLIYGPATSALLEGSGDLDHLMWQGALPEGKWLLIMTQPGMQRVIDSDGVSRFHELSQTPEPSFFPLEPGVNRISTVLGGMGATTSVTLMGLTRRWLIQG